MGPFTVGQVPADPQVWTVTDDAGNPRDLSAYTAKHFIMTDPNGVVTQPGTFDAYNPAFPGRLILRWAAPSPFIAEGTYLGVINLTGPGSINDYTREEAFEVEPAPGGIVVPTWCTVSQAVQITGQVVTGDELIAAQGVIDLVTNRTVEVSGGIHYRDLVWLGRAVAYQAVWMPSQPDIFTRSAINGVSQDGVSAQGQDKSWIYLAPLAARALRNCSWIRSRSLRVMSAFEDAGIGANAMVDDSVWNWQPMGAG